MSTQPRHGTIPTFTQGDRLRKARQLTGMTVREFAEHIGVSKGTVTTAENDGRATRRIVLNAWALATGVPLVWLETGNAPRPDSGPEGSTLPRLDSNQQPSDIQRGALPRVLRLGHHAA